MQKNDKLITIFTPSYNRGRTLGRLYESLLRQTNSSFVWVVVDDGSTDGTGDILEKWILEKKIEIFYFKQENKGKSAAHNVGVRHITTPLFSCVDSDDYLSDDAVEKIVKTWAMRQKGDIGIIALRSVTKLGRGHRPGSLIHTKLRDAYKNHIISGDAMLIFQSEVIAKYRFPEFSGEKFVPEAYLYDRLDQDGEMLLLDQVLYKGEYLEDGYTRNMNKIIKENPRGYLAYIVQRLEMDQSFMDRLLDSARYVSVAYTVRRKGILRNAPYPIVASLAFPMGIVRYILCFKGQ